MPTYFTYAQARLVANIVSKTLATTIVSNKHSRRCRASFMIHFQTLEVNILQFSILPPCRSPRPPTNFPFFTPSWPRFPPTLSMTPTSRQVYVSPCACVCCNIYGVHLQRYVNAWMFARMYTFICVPAFVHVNCACAHVYVLRKRQGGDDDS